MKLKAGIVVAFVFLLCVFQTAHAKKLENKNWIEVKTEHFTIRSMLSRRDTVETARYLEAFRAASLAITTVQNTEAPIPTNVYLLGTGGDFAKIGVSTNVVGYMQPSFRNYTLVARGGPGMDRDQVMMHEYVHFLERHHNSLNYPMWFNEGFAEYLSSAKLYGNIMKVGLIADHRLDSFRTTKWIPYKKILDEETYGKRWKSPEWAMFYAQSWALIHYLRNRDAERPMGEQMGLYMHLVERGLSKTDAFEQAFDIRFGKLDRTVRDYLIGGNFKYFTLDMSPLLDNLDVEIRNLSKEEVALDLGRLALQNHKYSNATKWFEIAASSNELKAHAEAGMGDIYKFQKKFEEALPHFAKALELAPANPYIQLDMAEYWHDLAEGQQDLESKLTHLKQARKHYVAAWKLDQSLPELYAMYGKSFLDGQDDLDHAIEMLAEAEYILPSNLYVRLWLADAYMQKNQKEMALSRARSVLAWGHAGSDLKNQAKVILDKLDPAVASAEVSQTAN